MELRDYQAAAVQSIYDYFAQGRGEAPLVVAPTGAGKSIILAEFMRRAHADFPGTRILLATHQKELIQQDFQALLRLWPVAPAGIYSAGLNQRRARAQMLFAGVQSIHRRTAEIGHVDLTIVDEAHLLPRSADTQYGRLIQGLRDINPAMKLVGLTATPFRLDSGRLDAGKGAIFDGIAYDIPIPMLVTRGYLAPLISKRPGMVFDTKGLRTRMGDFVESDLAARFDTEEATRAAVAETIALGADRRSWLLFCISVAHAHHVREELQRHGIVAATVTGATPASERDRLLRDFKAGHIRALTNVNVLTTGFDTPATDLLAFLRPTRSLGLYVQMAGRGMRVKPQGGDCLVLDFAGNVARHGPVDAVNAATAGEKRAGGGMPGEMPAKTCPECNSILWVAARECPDCGYVFPAPEPKIEKTASTEAIMNMTATDDWREVQDFDVARHVKDGRASLRVEYLIDGKVVRDWICLEHTGFPRRKAVQWWASMAGTRPPDTVAEALSRRSEIGVPAEAVILREGKYWRISRVRGEQRLPYAVVVDRPRALIGGRGMTTPIRDGRGWAQCGAKGWPGEGGMTMHHELITADMRTTSRVVAEKFGKRHDNVLRDIARLLNFEESNLPKGFTDLNFEFSSYLDSTGRSLPQYELTRDGFTLLAMGFTGKAAMAWKIRFIEAFNLMEAELKRRTTPPSREVPVYDDPLSNREWLALIRETRLANGTGAAQRVYAQSPFADYLREKDGPQHIAEPRPLTPEQEAQLGGFDMTLTEEAVLRAVHRSHAGPGSMRKTTQELGYLANIGPEEAHEACTRLSAFDLIRRNHFRRKLWDVTERGMQVLRAIDHNRREQST